MATIILRSKDLKARGIIRSHQQLLNMIKYAGFPPGRWLGPNTRAWTEDEVEEYLRARPTVRPEKATAKAEA